MTETPYVLYIQYNIRVTHEMGISANTHESDPRRDHQQIVLYSFCHHALALHLAVKILLQIFLYEDLSTLTLHTCRLHYPQNASGTALCYITNTIIENIPNI